LPEEGSHGRSITRAEFIRARELPPAIAELQAANIAPADMPQSAIGPGMGVFSRYKAVLESDDSPMSVKTALQLINRELDEYLGGIQGEFDADTRFAITWFEQNGNGKGDYGVADNLARARGISVDSVKHAGIVESAAGKVRILSRDELDEDWDPEDDRHLTVWECLQHLVRQHEKDGISHDTAVLLKKINTQAEAVKDLAYCLYDISANKRKDAKEATAYNALIADWAELTKAAAAIHDTSGIVRSGWIFEGERDVAKSTRQYVFEGMELLPSALIPFVEKRLETSLKGHWQFQVLEKLPNCAPTATARSAGIRPAVQRDGWLLERGVRQRSWPRRTLAGQRTARCPQQALAQRDLHLRRRRARARFHASADGGDQRRRDAEQLGKMRDTILRTKFTELQRNEERRKTQRLEISVETVAGLLPWREVVEPHQDVATGEFQQAEFAADLAKVHSGSAPPEYRDPRQFFSRTYLTEGLSALLIGAAKRLSGSGGDPVVELQTNFGGGKTHSMLALYHMAGRRRSRTSPAWTSCSRSRGSACRRASIGRCSSARRGAAGRAHAEGDRKIRTTWGELAWQLGGADAFAMVAENDASGIAPGSNLLEALFKKYAPCLILIDEWVAYLRQIYKVEGLPSGRSTRTCPSSSR
jgi:hypothetical protein